MTKFIKNNQKGFTLIELMIVVAIIGILAAIAIPNFLQYQLKSKTAEAKTNIGAIRTSQETYRAEEGAYLVCAASPNAVARATKVTWADAGTGFTDIGYEATGSVFYNYEVVVGVDGGASNVGMCIGASADLDSDGIAGEYGLLISSGIFAGFPAIITAAPATTGEVKDVNVGAF